MRSRCWRSIATGRIANVLASSRWWGMRSTTKRIHTLATWIITSYNSHNPTSPPLRSRTSTLLILNNSHLITFSANGANNVTCQSTSEWNTAIDAQNACINMITIVYCLIYVLVKKTKSTTLLSYTHTSITLVSCLCNLWVASRTMSR